MGFFDDVFDSVFGGTDTSAQDLQQAANAAARRDILAGTERAREDVLNLFPSGQQAQAQGFQAALDVLGQSIPGQTDVFTQGNVGAQGQLLAGLPQIQAAILGQPVDLSGLQPVNINAPTGFAQQRLPFEVAPNLLSGSSGDLERLLQRLTTPGGGGGGATAQPFPNPVRPIQQEGFGGSFGGGGGGAVFSQPSATGGGVDLAGLLSGLNPFTTSEDLTNLGLPANFSNLSNLNTAAIALPGLLGAGTQIGTGLGMLTAVQDRLAELGIPQLDLSDILAAITPVSTLTEQMQQNITEAARAAGTGSAAGADVGFGGVAGFGDFSGVEGVEPDFSGFA